MCYSSGSGSLSLILCLIPRPHWMIPRIRRMWVSCVCVCVLYMSVVSAHLRLCENGTFLFTASSLWFFCRDKTLCVPEEANFGICPAIVTTQCCYYLYAYIGLQEIRAISSQKRQWIQGIRADGLSPMVTHKNDFDSATIKISPHTPFIFTFFKLYSGELSCTLTQKRTEAISGAPISAQCTDHQQQ